MAHWMRAIVAREMRLWCKLRALSGTTTIDDDDDDDDDEEEVKDDAGCALTLSTLNATDHMDDDDDVASGDLFVTKPDKSTSTVGEDDEVEYESEASTVMSKVMLNRNVWPTEMVGV